MKIIVTGGAGFIGSHVVDKLLAENAKVTVIDNCSTGRPANVEHVKDKIEFIEDDIGTVGNWVSAFKNADWVIHLAALADIVPSIQQPEAYFKSNVTGTLNVLKAAADNKCQRFIYAASSSCYGICDVVPTPEDTEIKTEYPYALTKRLGEELVMHWEKVYGLPSLSLRFFNVYGPRSRTSGTYGAVFGVFLAQKLAGKPLTVVGDGTQTRDFTYVTDVAEAVVMSAKSDLSGEILNVGSGATISVNRIVELLECEKIFIPKRPGEPVCTFADIQKIQNLIGWKPTIGIEEGVSRLIENIDYWRAAEVWTPETISKATEDWFKFLGKAD